MSSPIAICAICSEVPNNIIGKCKVTVLFKTFALRVSKFKPCSTPRLIIQLISFQIQKTLCGEIGA